VKCAPLTIPVDHPAFAGHFPGMPVVPGAVLLDQVLHVLQEELTLNPAEWEITSAKFLEPVRPGDVLTVEHQAAPDLIRFAIRVAKPPAAQRSALAGTLARLRATASHEL
jgi:3-hydroxymyristoyl/3-hydroxydecanoyl-(acyl carrier protein) dehydratase